MESYLEDSRPTLDDICAEQNGECEGCPVYEFCHNEWDE